MPEKIVKKAMSTKKKPVAEKASAPKDTSKGAEKPVAEKAMGIKKKPSKDNFLFIALLVLIVVIVGIVVVVTIINKSEATNTNATDQNIADTNVNLVIEESFTEEQLQEKAIALQLKILQDIVNTQKNVFELWYQDLNLNKAEMDNCYEENNYLNQDLNFDNAGIFNKIIADTQLAQAIGITGTPTIFVNSYKIGGYVDYPKLQAIIDLALNEEQIDFNLDVNSYQADTTGKPKLIIIYNPESDFTSTMPDIYIDELKKGDYADFFTGLFSEVEIEKLNYREDKAKEIMETTKAAILPLFFFEGDINSTNFSKDELFSQVFIPAAGGYILMLPEQQNFNYKYFLTKDDYVIGYPDTHITIIIFTDYDCPYSTQLDNEAMENLKSEYIDKGLVNLVIKDFITHQTTSLFPAVFSRCAQKQGMYYDAHRTLFKNNQLYGNTAMESVYTNYDKDINELNEQYSKLSPEAQDTQ